MEYDKMPFLKVRGIKKKFGHVEALRGIDINAYEGEILAIVGDNGAGKSTLIKILSGVLEPDEGEMEFGGKLYDALTPKKAISIGVSTVYRLGNEVAGPRAKGYLYTNYKELGDVAEIDFTKGRIQEVLKACQILREQGEHVMLEVSGPITILNVLIDIKHIFKGMRKEPEFMKSVFQKVGTQILRYIEEAKKYGVDFISYADSAGGVNILGPKMAEQMVEDFTYDFLKEAQKCSDEHTLLMLCPKTTFALLGTEKAELSDIGVSNEITYGEGCIEVLGKAKMVGIQCAKNMGFLLRSGTMKEIVLK